MEKQPQKILCAIDFSDFTDTILLYSIGLCKEYQASLLVTHVVNDLRTLQVHNQTSIDIQALQKTNIEMATKNLENLIKNLDIDHDLIIRQGEPADEISRLALEQKTDLVVTATHGKSGIKRLLIGSVTEKLLKTVHCPLLVLSATKQPSGPEVRLQKILVGCDFSPDSSLSFDYSLDLALKFQSRLYLAHVIKPGDYAGKHQNLDSLRDLLKKKLMDLIPDAYPSPSPPETVLLEGEPYKELMNFAQDNSIDMIVLGIRGHTLWENLMVGSTTDRIIRHSPCPVLAVRQVV